MRGTKEGFCRDLKINMESLDSVLRLSEKEIGQ